MSSYVVFDSHCDTATELWLKGQELLHTSHMVSLDRTRQFRGYGQFFAFCTLAGADTGYTCEELLFRPHAYFMKQLKKYADAVSLCVNGADFDRALNAGKTAAFLSLEGAEGIGCDPGRLEQLREMGITMVNLTWNADNALAGCAKENGPGLSRQGREFVHRAQKLGMIIDVSHVSDRAFWDILDMTEKPVVASHSNSRRRCGHWRNLTDDQFKALCDCGGYAGINLFAAFLADEGPVTLETVYSHVDHFQQLSGGGHVALGGDLDGCDALPEGFSGIQDYDKLAALLEGKGYSGETVQNIFSNTMKKVVTQCTM